MLRKQWDSFIWGYLYRSWLISSILKAWRWIFRAPKKLFGRINQRLQRAVQGVKQEIEREAAYMAVKMKPYRICDEVNRQKCPDNCPHSRPHKLINECFSAVKNKRDYFKCPHGRDQLCKCNEIKVFICPKASVCTDYSCRHYKPHAYESSCTHGNYCKHVHEYVDCIPSFRHLSDKEKTEFINESFTARRRRKG